MSKIDMCFNNVLGCLSDLLKPLYASVTVAAAGRCNISQFHLQTTRSSFNHQVYFALSVADIKMFIALLHHDVDVLAVHFILHTEM